jgi:hypothetical protein
MGPCTDEVDAIRILEGTPTSATRFAWQPARGWGDLAGGRYRPPTSRFPVTCRKATATAAFPTNGDVLHEQLLPHTVQGVRSERGSTGRPTPLSARRAPNHLKGSLRGRSRPARGQPACRRRAEGNEGKKLPGRSEATFPSSRIICRVAAPPHRRRSSQRSTRLATRGSSLPSHRHRGQPHPDPWELPLSIEQQPTLPGGAKGPTPAPCLGRRRPGCSARASRRWSGTGAGRRRSRWPEPEAARGSRAGSAHGERLDHLPPSGELDAASDPGGLQPGSHPDRAEGVANNPAHGADDRAEARH